MTSFLPSEFKIKVKDRLRDMRFMAQEMRPQAPQSEQINGLPGRDGPVSVTALTRKISDMSENALQKLETVAIGFLSSDPAAHFAEARACPLDRYDGHGHHSAASMFSRDSYFAAKQILRSKGCSNPRLSEELFAAAYRLAATDFNRVDDERSEAVGGSLDLIARDASMLSLAIMRTRPVLAPLLFEDDAGARTFNTSIYIAAAIGLATGVATYHRETLSAEDPVYASVCAAVDARYGFMEKAIVEMDEAQLARVFVDLIPHLP